MPPPPTTTEDQQSPETTPYIRVPATVRDDRDMRAKRPPALSFLLRLETLRRIARITSLLALDVAAVVLALVTAIGLKAAVRGDFELSEVWHATRDVVAFACLVTLLLFARSGLYAERASRPGLTRIVASLTQVAAVALIFALVQGQEFSSYYVFYGSLFFAVLYVSTFRFVYERVTGWILRMAGYRRNAVLVGTGAHIEAVAHALDASAHSPINVIGFISMTPRPHNGLRSLGTLDHLPEVLRENTVDEVIITDPDFPQLEAVELVDRCHAHGVRVRIAPSTMEILIHRAEFVPGQGVPLFEMRPPVFEGIDFAVKRTFDLVCASLLLLVLSPVLLASALVVKATSRGPLIYRSRRPGIGGQPFDCLKFRTMYEGSERAQAELEAANEASGALFKIRSDPRVTSVGRVLRRFSIDELPQLWNVIRGEMSLVGPRPLPQRDYEQLEDWHRKRYLVLPGVTGLWQVSGRSDLDFDDLVRLDFLYLERWSVFLDLTIMVKTVPAVLSRRGAF
jgi:exopolysaccharide biosynthesis polyprenyl glycosylphosphotransferase